MESILTSVVSYEELVKWLITAFIVCLAAMKFYPVLKDRMTASDRSKAEMVAKIDALCTKVDGLQTEVAELSDKVGRDYERLNKLEEETERQGQRINDSLEEREIITFGLLSCLRGLQEQGCNGPVSEGIDRLEQYMMQKAHK